MNNDRTKKEPGKENTLAIKDWVKVCNKTIPGITIPSPENDTNGGNNSTRYQVFIPLRKPGEEKEPWTIESLRESIIQSQMKHKGLTREEAEEIISMYF